MVDGGGMTATAGMGEEGKGIIAIGGGLLTPVLPLLVSAVMVAGGVGNDERAGDACADPPALPSGGGAVTFLLSMLMTDRPCTPLPVGRMSGRGGNVCKFSRDPTVKKREEL